MSRLGWLAGSCLFGACTSGAAWAADPADLRWRGGLIMRGLRELPVAFTPEPSGGRDTV